MTAVSSAEQVATTLIRPTDRLWYRLRVPSALPSPLTAPQLRTSAVGPAPGNSSTPMPAASRPKACATVVTGPASRRRLATPAPKSEVP